MRVLDAGYAVLWGLDGVEIRRLDPASLPVHTLTVVNQRRDVEAAKAFAQENPQVPLIYPEGAHGLQELAQETVVGNAKVTVTEWGYDDTVRWTRDYAQRNGYVLVQDTVLENYHEIPQNIVLGYTTMIREVVQQIAEQALDKPTHVFLQAGVGSMAGGVLGWLADTLKAEMPVVSIIEATDSACVFASCTQGTLVSKAGITPTIMAGLNCGEVNPDLFPVLSDYASFYFACADEITEAGMRQYAQPLEGDEAIVSGESGAVGLGLLLSLCQDPHYEAMKQALGLDEHSVVLLLNTEGATDPDDYRRVVGCDPQLVGK